MISTITHVGTRLMIGPHGSPADGWSASLSLEDAPGRPVPLARVYCWDDIADHAATFGATVVVSRSIVAMLVRLGRWTDNAAPNTILLEA